MPVQTIPIDKKGGTVRVEIVFSGPYVGLYKLRLVENGSNADLLVVSGNNQNPEDDVYALPMPAKANVGRFLQCTLTFIDPRPKPTGNYKGEVKVTQDGATCGVLAVDGQMTQRDVTRTIFGKLT